MATQRCHSSAAQPPNSSTQASIIPAVFDASSGAEHAPFPNRSHTCGALFDHIGQTTIMRSGLHAARAFTGDGMLLAREHARQTPVHADCRGMS